MKKKKKISLWINSEEMPACNLIIQTPGDCGARRQAIMFHLNLVYPATIAITSSWEYTMAAHSQPGLDGTPLEQIIILIWASLRALIIMMPPKTRFSGWVSKHFTMRIVILYSHPKEKL